MIDFELKSAKSYNTECPRCSPGRTKKDQKCLLVHRDVDGFIRFKCYHSADCDYGDWKKVVDPDPTTVPSEPVKKTAWTPIPSFVTLPTEWLGGSVYWYRDIEGAPLYGVIRWTSSDGSKRFSPLVYDIDGGWLGGSQATYPDVQTLYGAEQLQKYSKVLVVEGEKAADVGAALLNQKGYAVVTWRGGANNVKTQPWHLLQGKEVILWPDNDAAGHQAMETIAKLVPALSIKILNVVHLPPKSDIADKLPAEDVRKAFETAKVVDTGYKGPLTWTQIVERIENTVSSIPTGFEVIDQHIKLQPSGLVTILGRTGHGKTLLAIAFAVKWLQAGRRVVFMSYEEPAQRLLYRFAKAINPDLDQAMYHRAPEGRVLEGWITSGLLEIYDQDSQVSSATLLRTFDHDSYKEALVVVDNLQILPFTSSASARYMVLKEQFIDPIRIVANKRGFVAMVLCQLTPNELNPTADTPREGKDVLMSSELVLRVWNKNDFSEHPFLNFIKGNYAVHVVKNRTGITNIVFDCVAVSGAKLEVNGVLTNKMVQAYLRQAKKASPKRGDIDDSTDFDEAF